MANLLCVSLDEHGKLHASTRRVRWQVYSLNYPSAELITSSNAPSRAFTGVILTATIGWVLLFIQTHVKCE